MELALHIAHPAVDFTTTHPLIEGFEQLREGLICHRNEFQREEQGNQTRIGIPIVTEVEVTGVLTAEDGILLAHVSLDIGMPNASTHRLATQLFDERRYALRNDQVVEDG